MRKLTVAQQLVDILRQAGVERIYGVVGDSLNSVVDAVRRTDGIEWVHVRNEETAAFAAAAEAQLTGRLAVCAGSRGPGNTHLIQGLYDAHRSGAPVLALASHIPSHQIGTGSFQETHPERLFTECSDFCEMISTPGQMPRVLRIAMQRALGNSAVSVLVIPGDVARRGVARARERPRRTVPGRPGDRPQRAKAAQGGPDEQGAAKQATSPVMSGVDGGAVEFEAVREGMRVGQVGDANCGDPAGELGAVASDGVQGLSEPARETGEFNHLGAGVGEFAQECVGQAVRPTVMTAASSTGPDRTAFGTSVLDAASQPSRMRPSCFTPKERLQFDLH